MMSRCCNKFNKENQTMDGAVNYIFSGVKPNKCGSSM
jgi:hypothetical protein